jgi:hypothetical protein
VECNSHKRSISPGVQAYWLCNCHTPDWTQILTQIMTPSIPSPGSTVYPQYLVCCKSWRSSWDCFGEVRGQWHQSDDICLVGSCCDDAWHSGVLNVMIRYNINKNSAHCFLAPHVVYRGLPSALALFWFLVEGIGQIRVLLPVMIVVAISNYFAYLIHKACAQESNRCVD